MVSIPEVGQLTNQTQDVNKKDSSALGQEEFLTLLVAQLQNQDPLNPTDATEFTAQLAQYSQLEQLFNLNSSMDQLAASQNNSQRVSALSLIGKEILVEGSNFHMGDEPAQIGYKVSGAVTEADMSIRNQYGKTVRKMSLDDLSIGNHTVTWDGKDSQGNILNEGQYSISIQTQGDEDGQSASNINPLVRAEVTGVNLEGAVPMLVTSSGEFAIESIHGAFDQSNNQAESEEPTEGSETEAVSASTQEDTNSAATDGAEVIEDSTDTEEQSA